jgi:hypothetical protein
MAGSVGHNERPAVGREIPIRDVDRDSLLALGLEAIEDQRIIELGALRAKPPRIPLKRRQLVLE